MSIHIKNFGPITKGKIDMRPLTILIGPNNSGKSYVAMLVHSILSSGEMYGATSMHRLRRNHAYSGTYRKYLSDFEDIINKNEGRDSFDIPQQFIKRVFFSTCERIESQIKFQLERNFGAEVKNLVKNGTFAAQLDITSSQDFVIKMNHTLKISPSLPSISKYKFETTTDHKQVSSEHATYRSDGDTTVITSHRSSPSRFLAYEVLDCLIDSITNKINLTSKTSHYLPASRSGILQGHKALTAGIIQSAEFAGIESINVPKLTGVVSDFISSIILIPRRRGRFSDMAEQIERDMLKGRIKLDYHNGHSTMPEVTYVTGDGSFVLHRASSTVSEIAPLSLYMKYMINKNDMLIIEEPESHLHPKNQLVLAKYVVKMIRSGLNVLLTTHSEFLLEKLGKFVVASNVDPKIRGEILGADAEDCIRADEVSVHLFRPDNNNDVHIHTLETDADLGISQEEFADVSQSLYDESIKLEDAVKP